MPDEWYYRAGDGNVGPLHLEHMRDLVRGGDIQPATPVFNDAAAGWVSAGAVPELFPDANAANAKGFAGGAFSVPFNPEASPHDVPVVASTGGPREFDGQGNRGCLSEFFYNPVVIGLCLFLCCFPLGLLLVWTNRRWSVTTRFLWTAIWLALFLAFCHVTVNHKNFHWNFQNRGRLNRADAAWAAGNHQQAIKDYHIMISNGQVVAVPAAAPTIFGRVIDYDARHNNKLDAKAMIDAALADGVTPRLTDPKALRMLKKERARRVRHAK